jgi:plastocyanin
MTRHRISFVTALVISAGAMVAAAPAYAGGGIEGTVSYARGAGDLLVYVVKVPRTFAPPKEHSVIDQKGIRFSPHVLPILVGTTVDFVNGDPVSHNVFSPDNEGYNLGTWPKAERRSYTFKRVQVYTQLCSIHPDMEAFIIVLQNPYFATTTADGHFTIADLPPGHYEIKVWGERLKSAQKNKSFRVDVTAERTKTTLAL